MVEDIRAQVQASLGDTHTIERELGGGVMSRTFVLLERALSRRSRPVAPSPVRQASATTTTGPEAS